MERYDVVVIGAGNGGLTSAAILAQKGVKVLLLERHNIPGGCATSFCRGRFEFEVALHQLSGMGTPERPGPLRGLLGDIGVLDDLEFVEMPDADRCCGSAGIYTLTHFDISMQLLDARMQQVLRTGAQVVATANPGCFMQMRLGVARAGLSGQIRVAHVVVLVAEALPGLGPGVQGAR